MCVVVYAEASEGSNPGHMAIGQKPPGGALAYFGYRFDPADLPVEYRSAERWRDYLFDHAVPGKIEDETAYVRHLLEDATRTYRWKCADCDTPVERYLPDRGEWGRHAWYSFNPDGPAPPTRLHPADQQPCYNCVKWAVEIANRCVEGFLPAVPQGRLKLILVHLEQRPA